jgi:hypothetical protein
MDNNSKLSSIVNNLNSTQIGIFMAIAMSVYHMKDQLDMFFITLSLVLWPRVVLYLTTSSSRLGTWNIRF